jgi:hypothetical protein
MSKVSDDVDRAFAGETILAKETMEEDNGLKAALRRWQLATSEVLRYGARIASLR